MTKTKTTIFAMIFAAVTIGLLVSTISVSNIANAQSTVNVPSWIQNVAGFWSSGDVSDDEFVNAMTFLVEEGIMDLPNVVSPAEAQTITSSLEEMDQRLEKIETQTSTGEVTTTPSTPPTPEEDESTQYDSVCPASKVQHWNKIIFSYSGNTQSDKGYPSITADRPYEMIVQGTTGGITDLQRTVADRLIEMKYSTLFSEDTITASVTIIDVDYAVICAQDPTPFVPSPMK